MGHKEYQEACEYRSKVLDERVREADFKAWFRKRNREEVKAEAKRVLDAQRAREVR